MKDDQSRFLDLATRGFGERVDERHRAKDVITKELKGDREAMSRASSVLEGSFNHDGVRRGFIFLCAVFLGGLTLFIGGIHFKSITKAAVGYIWRARG